MKRKIRIPVVVCPNGELMNGSVHLGADEVQGSIKKDHWDFAIDGISEEGYGMGYAVVVIEAEIDVDEVFKQRTTTGNIELKHGVPAIHAAKDA